MSPIDPKKFEDPNIVEKLSRVIFEATRSKLLEKVGSMPYDSNEFESFFISLMKESDRALAIVSFSYIDSKLIELFTNEMNNDISGGAESLFSSNGPLGNSSSRIKMAFALNWISQDIYRDLELIRKIRNEFAHKHYTIDFSNGIILGYLSSMNQTENRILEYAEWAPEMGEVTNRIRYHLRAALVGQRMISEMMTAPTALRLGLPPFSAFSSDHSKLPEPLSKLLYAVAGVTREILLDLFKKNCPHCS